MAPVCVSGTGKLPDNGEKELQHTRILRCDNTLTSKSPIDPSSRFVNAEVDIPTT
jgi:hypothetical protein